jgi:hypothetical protein
MGSVNESSGWVLVTMRSGQRGETAHRRVIAEAKDREHLKEDVTTEHLCNERYRVREDEALSMAFAGAAVAVDDCTDDFRDTFNEALPGAKEQK